MHATKRTLSPPPPSPFIPSSHVWIAPKRQIFAETIFCSSALVLLRSVCCDAADDNNDDKRATSRWFFPRTRAPNGSRNARPARRLCRHAGGFQGLLFVLLLAFCFSFPSKFCTSGAGSREGDGGGGCQRCQRVYVPRLLIWRFLITMLILFMRASVVRCVEWRSSAARS